MTPGMRMIAAVAFQFLILSSVIGYKQYTVWTGETVVLKVQPIDPRSLFQGDYVSLTYDVTRLDTAALAGDDYFGEGQAVYVELARGEDGFWHAVAAYRKRRDVAGGHILIKGNVSRQTPFPDLRTVMVTYGVEEVFVPEGSGRDVERVTREGNLGVEVKVDRFGNAVARRILIDGQPFPLKRK